MDVWMTTTAIANDLKICQAFLGAKIHDPKDPGAGLSAMLYPGGGGAFGPLGEYPGGWKKVIRSEPLQTFGFHYAVGLEPVSVNLDRMIEQFRLGVKELMEIWKLFLPLGTVAFLERAAAFPKEDFLIPDETWVEVIYSLALAAHRKTIHKEHLLKSLTPLYIGRTASFVNETWESDASEGEEEMGPR